MSWRNSVFFLLLLVSGCGFTPMYGEKADASFSDVLAGVKVDYIAGRMGQEFKEHLEDQLNPGGAVPPNPTYRLTATLVSSTTAIGVSRDGTVSRYNVYLDSTYTLFRLSDGKAITSGKLRHVSSYNNITNAYFTTYVSEDDAIKRGIAELSQTYRQRLDAYLQAGAPVQNAPAPTLGTTAPANPFNTINANPVVGTPLNQMNRAP